MDANQFDEFSRTLSQSPTRRGVLRTVTGAVIAGAFAALPGLHLHDAEAKRRKRKRRRKNKSAPTTCVPNCAGKTCGADGCGGSCGECTGGRTCSEGICACAQGQEVCGGACHAPCAAPSVRNPINCTCCLPFDAPCGPNCCSPLGCKGIACNAGEESQTCGFDAQCRPPLVCNASNECRNA
jgi:hypothetical protein